MQREILTRRPRVRRAQVSARAATAASKNGAVGTKVNSLSIDRTLIGLSGLGDLVLTCGSPNSRNMSLGMALGQGMSAEEALSGRLTVTEGVATARAMVEIARARGIELPIAEAVHAVITGQTTVDAAIGALLSRPLRSEI